MPSNSPCGLLLFYNVGHTYIRRIWFNVGGYTRLSKLLIASFDKEKFMLRRTEAVVNPKWGIFFVSNLIDISKISKHKSFASLIFRIAQVISVIHMHFRQDSHVLHHNYKIVRY